MTRKLDFIIYLCVAVVLNAHSAPIVSVHLKKNSKDSRDFAKECKEVTKYAVGKSFSVKCSVDYHHFNYQHNNLPSTSKKKLKIAEFNVLHPGMSKTRFKDYKKIASLMNKWDIIGVTELLPLVGKDLEQNNALVKFIEVTAPKKIRSYQNLKEDLSIKLKKTSRKRSIKSLKRRINVAKEMINFYKAEIEKAKKHYREPGYLKILNELHKLKGGSQWSLILSPFGEAAKSTDTHELVGYYYKSNSVKPMINDYCKDTQSGSLPPIACIAKMKKKMLGEDKDDIFSRRPFMASFKANSFTFTLLTSHVVFTSPKKKDLIEKILKKSFGVKHWNDLSIGINGGNYARFAEVKTTLDFIKSLRKKYFEKDIIFMGDLNLKYKNRFWSTVLKSIPGFELFINQKTSLSRARFNSKGEVTNGLSSDYDHFLLDPSYTSECLDTQSSVQARVENFLKGSLGRFVKRAYEIRTDRIDEFTYNYNKKKSDRLLKKFVIPFLNESKTIKKIGNKKLLIGNKTYSVRGLITAQREIDFYTDFFEERILKSQLADDTYYSFYTDILSDHLPIVLTCKI